MGYDTTFEGEFRLNRPLTAEHLRFLQEFALQEHVPGEDGKPVEEAASGRPCLYCQWRPTDDGEAIEWDGGEKFYGWLEWLNHLVEHFIKPWGYVMNGEVCWRGEEFGDNGTLYVADNRVEAVADVNPGPSWHRTFREVSRG